MAEPVPSDSVETVWERMAQRYPLIDLQSTDSDALDELLRGLIELFTELGVPDAASRIVIPEDYSRFLSIAGGTRRLGGDFGTYLFGPKDVLAYTAMDSRLFAEERPADAAAWLTIGHWMDKHDLVLCCDRADARFGNAVEAHDDHPWNDGGSNTKRADTFTECLKDFLSPD